MCLRVCVKKSFFKHIQMKDFQVVKMRISRCCLSVALFEAKICLQGLRRV